MKERSGKMMWKHFQDMDCRYGIDLGTCNTLIYQKGKGIVLREPSVIAVRRETGDVEAVGEEAQAMIGRTPDSIEVVAPIQDGVIADLPMTLAMLRHFVKRLAGGPFRFMQRREFVISVPYGIDSVKRRAVETTMMQLGAKKVMTVEEPLAAAMGSGIPVEEPVGSMVIDVGGGTTQAAILSLGGLVVGHAVRTAGTSIDETIMDYVKSAYNLAIGRSTAERIKQQIGSAVEPDPEERMEIRGRNLVDGLPKSMTLGSDEIYCLLRDFIRNLIEAIRICLEKCPPELVGDIMERGIMLCGGGALLRGLDHRLQAETKVPVYIADQPLECVAIGAGKLLD
jgi:rod shape-determining protein MreB